MMAGSMFHRSISSTAIAETRIEPQDFSDLVDGVLLVPARRSFSQAAMLQTAAKPADLDPDHWIRNWDKTCTPLEGDKSYGAGLDPISTPGKNFPHDELEKAPRPVGVDDSSTGADTLECIINELFNELWRNSPVVIE
jgi:hypothetical protein